MIEYVVPILFFLGLGALAGVLLTVASRFLAVKTDETVEKITEALPGANCGGCGYSGCAGYAEAVAKGEAPTNLCKPGGADVTAEISAIMGVEAVAAEREVAFVRCNGSCNATTDKYNYIGTPTCLASEKFFNGKGACRSGCLGFGDCVSVCDREAISVVDGVAVINPAKCGSCGKCVKACPNHLIVMRRESQRVIVRCSSIDTGKVTRSVCKNGCIACKLCEKKCSYDAIHVNNNHAEIDPEKCTRCGECAAACPAKCITILPECVK